MTSSHTPPEAPHDTSLDGLRGVAALVVIIHHYALMLYPTMVLNDPAQAKSTFDAWVATTPLNLFIGGHFSVCLFFVLSAYVLTRKHVGQPDGLPLILSIAKRYPRLGIPIFASVILCFIALFIRTFFLHGGWDIIKNEQWVFFSQFIPFLQKALIEGTTGAILYGLNNFNGPLWTMQIEFYGSLGVFLFLFLFDTTSWRWRVALYGIATILAWRTYYLAFILGLILSEIQVRRTHWFQWIGSRSWVAIVLAGSGLFLGSIPVFFENWDSTFYDFLPRGGWLQGYHILGALFLVVAVINNNVLRSWLSTPLCHFIGKISFAMYLTHVVVLEYFSRTIIHLLESGIGYHWATGVMLFPTLALVFWVSWHFTLWFDKPAIRFPNRVSHYIEKRCRPHALPAHCVQ